MQKKIFTSLLVSPLAFGALANINVGSFDNEEWKSNSVTGGTLLETTDSEVIGKVGVGTITQTVDVPCQGNYQVQFTASTGSLSIEVSGVKEFKVSDNGLVTFTANGKGTVTFSVSSKNAAQGFAFATGALEIVYDFAAENARMTQELADVASIPPITANPDEKKYPAAAALKTQLEGERTAQIAKASDTGDIQKQIDKIVETGDAAKDLKTYVDNKLWEDPNTIQAQINALADVTETLTDKINNFNTNYPALVGLDGGASDLENDLNAQANRIAAATVVASSQAADLEDARKTDAANYVNTTCAAGVNTAKANLAKYKEEIAAAYADLTGKVDFEPTKNQAALQQEINTLTGNIDTAYQSISDYAYVYGQTTGLLAQLKNTSDTAEDFVLGIKSVNPAQPGVWSIQQANWLNEINAGVKLAASLNETSFETATKDKAANTSAYNEATTAVNAVVAAATTLSEAQNGAMTAALATYDSENEKYEDAANSDAVKDLYAAMGQPIPADYTTKDNAAKAALQALMDAMKNGYAALDLEESDYATQLADAETAIANLATYTSAIKPKIDAQEELNRFKQYLEAEQEELANDQIPANFLVEKFTGNINALQLAVIAVTDQTSSDNVQGSIAANKALAEKLVTALQAAYGAYTDFHTQIEWLKNNTKVNTLVDGSAYEDATLATDIETYEEQDAEWSAKYVEVADLAPEQCYEEAKALGDEITASKWQAKVNATFATYINGLTQGDYDAVKNALNDIATYIPSLVTPAPDKDGNETSPYLIALAALNSIDVAGATSMSSEDKEAKLEACQEVIDQLQNLWNTQVSGMYGNVADYEELSGLVSTQLGTHLADLNAFINKYSTSDAYAKYKQMSSDLKKDLEGIQTALDNQLKKLEVTKNKVTTKAAIDADKAKNGANGTIAQTISKNEAAHNEELEAAKGAQKAIIETLAAIEANQGASEFATKWIQQLVDLRDNALETANKNVQNAYVAVDCDAQNSALLKAYEDINAAVDNILVSFEGGWDTVVAEQNNSLLNGDAWKLAQSNMNSVYVDAINAFNAYVGLNDGYSSSDEFKDVVTNNASLYDYSAQARTLINDVNDAVRSATRNSQALTDSDFQELALDKADKIIKEMTDAADKMIAGFNKAAEDYYGNASTGLLGDANQAMVDATALLKGYGYTDAQIEEILADYYDQIDEQEQAYADAEEVPAKLYDEDGKLSYKATVGYAMGAIADVLDGVIAYNLNPQVIAKDWAPYYANFDFAALATELAKYKDITAIADIFKAQSEIFNTNKTNAENLNKNIGTFGNLLTKTNGKSLLQQKKDDLQGYYNAAYAAVEAVKTAAKNNETVTGFDKALTNANTDITALKNIITLAGPATDNVSIEDAVAKVNAFNTTLGNYKNGKATKDQVDAAKTAAQTAINTAFSKAGAAENKFLNGTDNPADALLNILKVAYNDAYAYEVDKTGNEDNEVKTLYQGRVDKCVTGFAAISQIATISDLTKYYNDAKTLEDEIAALIVALQNYVTPQGGSTLEAVRDDFKESYDKSVEKVETAQTALDDMNQLVQDEYASEYAELISQLETVKSQFDQLGANQIVDAPDYKNQLDAIVAQITEIKANIVTAEANAAIYDKLYEQWNEGVNADVTDLIAKAEEYKVYGIYAVQLAALKVESDAIATDLKEQYEARTLTADTSFDDAAEAINGKLQLYTLQINKSYGYALDESIVSQIKDVEAWLKDLVDNDIKLIPDAAGEQVSVLDKLGDIKEARHQANLKLGDYQPTDYVGDTAKEGMDYQQGLDAINVILDAYKEIQAEVGDLLDAAENSSYQLGDLNGDGVVTVADAQVMRQLILNGVTFEDLIKDGEVREAYAANIVANDKIDIADYTALISIILNQNEQEEAASATGARKISRSAFFGVRNSVESEGSIMISAVAEENGIRTYAVEINDPEAFVAGQIDFIVESTSRILNVRGAERLNAHDVAFQDNGSATRVVITSLDNSVFEASQGATLYVEVEGRSGLGFNNAIFADENAQAYTFAAKSTDTTAIDSLYEGAKAVKEAVYDAAGRVMKSVQRGINIIRKSDGTVTKEIRK